MAAKMPKSSTTAAFPYIHADPATLPSSVDPFTVTTARGFLPFASPLINLPAPFRPLADLLDRMPVVKADGSPGLLAEYRLGAAVEGDGKRGGGFPDLTEQVDAVVFGGKEGGSGGTAELDVATALFRDYSFLASAYLLEPCWERWVKAPAEGYGLGRDRLPHSVAGPLVRLGQILDIPPFLSYAAAYALYNYKLLDPAAGLANYTNLSLIRAFERGLDPASSEAGFVLTHIDMVRFSAELVAGAVAVLDGVEAARTDPAGQREKVDDGFRGIIAAMEKIEGRMEEMWKHSKPSDYLSFRVFIFGITSQSMFPHGVVYEGTYENKPLHFRGESGANDSMIPLLDHLLQTPMPSTPLTTILHEFRAYRPLPQRAFLAHVAAAADRLGVAAYAMGEEEAERKEEKGKGETPSPTPTTTLTTMNATTPTPATTPATTTTLLFLRVLDGVRSFRWRHWLFTREYIIRRSPHPTATGGSPIVTWLPNQLFAVMDRMLAAYDAHIAPLEHLIGADADANGVNGVNGTTTTATVDGHHAHPTNRDRATQTRDLPSPRQLAQAREMIANVREQRTRLEREVEKWCKERGV